MRGMISRCQCGVRGRVVGSRWSSTVKGMPDGKLAVTAPGQGIVGGGFLVPYKTYQRSFQDLLDEVDEGLSEKFSSKLLGEDTTARSGEWLMSTANAQPAILATTYILHQIMKREFGVDLVSRADYVLGHSLGEYTSLALTGVIGFGEAVRLVRARGKKFEEIVGTGDYGMVALSFRPQSFDEVCRRAGASIANINSYSQIVLSGKLADIHNTVDAINSPRKLVLRATQLPVRIPFHSSILRPVEQELLSFVTTVNEPCKPIISNLMGSSSSHPYEDTILANSRPVQWVKSMEYLISSGVSRVVNVGPGSVLQGLNSRFDLQNLSLDSLEAMENYAKSLH